MPGPIGQDRGGLPLPSPDAGTASMVRMDNPAVARAENFVHRRLVQRG